MKNNALHFRHKSLKERKCLASASYIKVCRTTVRRESSVGLRPCCVVRWSNIHFHCKNARRTTSTGRFCISSMINEHLFPAPQVSPDCFCNAEKERSAVIPNNQSTRRRLRAWRWNALHCLSPGSSLTNPGLFCAPSIQANQWTKLHKHVAGA